MAARSTDWRRLHWDFRWCEWEYWSDGDNDHQQKEPWKLINDRFLFLRATGYHMLWKMPPDSWTPKTILRRSCYHYSLRQYSMLSSYLVLRLKSRPDRDRFRDIGSRPAQSLLSSCKPWHSFGRSSAGQACFGEHGSGPSS